MKKTLKLNLDVVKSLTHAEAAAIAGGTGAATSTASNESQSGCQITKP